MKRFAILIFIVATIVSTPVVQAIALPSEPVVEDKEVFQTPDKLSPRIPKLTPEEKVMRQAVAETLRQGLCVEWIDTALLAGWNPTDLPKLMRIMHRESRCLPDACGETDSPHIRKCRDWGLMQINDYSWKRVIRELGWEIEQMHDPLENLKFAKWLFDYSLGRNGDGWNPWKLPAK